MQVISNLPRRKGHCISCFYHGEIVKKMDLNVYDYRLCENCCSFNLQVSQNELQSPKSESSVAPAALGVELSLPPRATTHLSSHRPPPPPPFPSPPPHNVLSFFSLTRMPPALAV